MNVWKIFSSKERVEALEFILERDEVGVEEVASSINRSKGFASQFLKLLEEERILEKKKRRYAVLDSPEVKAIKIMLNTVKLQKSLNKHKRDWMISVGVYGSYSKGTNKRDSDIDMWIKVDKYPEEKEVARVEKDISNELGKSLHLLILTPEKITKLRESDPVFYCELVNSFVMWGEGIGF